MLFEKRKVLDWINYDPGEFSKAYHSREFSDFRNFLEHRLRNDSIRFLRRLDLSDNVFFQIRQKRPANLLNKIVKIAKSLAAGNDEFLSNRTKSKIDPTKQYFLYEFIKDIVAVRYICLDYGALETLLKLILRSESLRISDYEIYRPFFSEYDRTGDDISLDLFETVAAERPNVLYKTSNYESIHLEVRFGAPVDLQSVKKLSGDLISSRGYSIPDTDGGDALSKKLFDFRMQIQQDLYDSLSPESLKIIPEFPIEIQIRTSTQHIWAQDEHRFVYSIIKGGSGSVDNDVLNQTRAAFTGLKFFLHSSDSLRRLIRALHTKQSNKLSVLDAKGMEVSTRLAFFADERFEKIRNRLEELDKRTTVYTRNRKSGAFSHREFYREALVTLKAIVSDAASIEPDYFSSRHKGDFSYWARQRVVAMILGFVFLFCIEEDIDADRLSLDSKANLRRFLAEELGLQNLLGALVSEDEYRFLQNYTANLAARTYEFIKTNDRYFLDYDLHPSAVAHVFDPLIFARHATALYRMGEFAGAYRGLREFFESSHYDDKYWSSMAHKGHSEIELRDRLLQYYWYKADLDADEISGSLDGLERLMQELDRAVSRSHGSTVEKDVITSCCWVVWIYGVLRALRIPIGRALQELFEKFIGRVKSITASDEVRQKVYWHAAQAVISLTIGSLVEAKNSLSSAYAIASTGIPHPADAVTIQKNMLDLLQSESVKFKYDLFLSYSRSDAGLAEIVVSEFNKLNVAVFVDFENVQIGSQITPAIEAGLRGSKNILMLVTKRYIERQWPDWERIWFSTRERWIGDRKFFVILQGVKIEEFQERYPILADRHVYELSNKSSSGEIRKFAREVAFALGSSAKN